jgi:hypothetical protein
VAKKKTSPQLKYGARKYAAFSLLISRWIRSGGAHAKNYVYVTLGGTELADIKSLYFIDPGFVAQTVAFEVDRDRFQLATQAKTAMQSTGINLTVSSSNLFDYKRVNDAPHIFYIDLLGVFAWSDYDVRVGKMFQREVIKEGDCVLITSHLGHRPGIEAVRKTYSGELSVLGVSDEDEIAQLYRRGHPSFTLFKALTRYRLARELNLKCFGCVKYRDTTPMGIYGYVVSSGMTELRELIDDSSTGYFDMNAIAACPSQDF